MKRFSATLIIFLTIGFAQNICAQKTFKLGFVKEFNFAGDLIWLANTKEKDQIDSKAVAVLGNGYECSGIINLNGCDIELRMSKDYLPDKNLKLVEAVIKFGKVKI